MFGKKQREIERLKAVIRDREFKITELRGYVERAERHTHDLEVEVAELERTQQASYDMNVLFAAILDYRKILWRMVLPDPVAEQGELQRVFAKYRINMPDLQKKLTR